MVEIQKPKDIAEQFRPDNFPVGVPVRLLTASFLLILITVLSYLGLQFGYQAFLESRIETIDNQLQQLSGTVSKEDQEKFIVFYSQLVNFKKILDNHITSSKVFPLLENITNKKVFYGGWNLSTDERKLTLQGTAASYEVLAEQLTAFSQEPSVESYVLNSAQFTGGVVKFNAILVLKEEVLQ